MKKTILSFSLFLALGSLLVGSRANAQISVGISVHIAPPAIPVYVQPACPTDGYLWVPGYWAWGGDEDGYYWVPGYWSAPPTVGFLWTPGYWGFSGGYYGWHGGYWGQHVGFYGGVNYGFGYGGVGYGGGNWEGGHFRYNTAVTNVNTTVIHNTYINRTVINNTTVNNRVSYNGGAGGIQARPTAQEQVAMNEHHVAATAAQTQHEQVARQDKSAFANVNHGRPATAAVVRPVTNVSQLHAASNAPAASAAHMNAATAHNNAATTHNNVPSTHNNAAATHSNAPAANRTPVTRPVNNSAPIHTNTASHPQQMHTTQPRPQVSHPAPPHPAPHPSGGEPHGGGEHHR